ncbi:MAG: hypothetical protein ABI551_09245 [Polyangiaceae bacterium]
MLSACSLADGGVVGLEPGDGAVQDASFVDAQSGDDAAPPSDAGADAAACASLCPNGFACSDSVCTDRAEIAFATNENPTGNWLYFHLLLDAGALTYPSEWRPDDSGIVLWSPEAGTLTPFVAENPTDQIAHPFGTTSFPPHTFGAHPASDGSWSVVRWIAPKTASYTVHLHASGASYDAHPTTTDVHLFKNGSEIAVGYVNVDGGTNDAFFTPVSAALNAGDTLDVRVAFGNGDFSFDSTALDLAITTP